MFQTLKVTDVLNDAASYLKRNGISNSRLDARLLLQYVLKQSAEFLIREPDHSCTHDQLAIFEQLLLRRAHHEPVSKIIGTREFWGLPFIVTKDVLDPRPDSETLIEVVRQTLPDRYHEYQILDLGVGSGCLLLSLLYEYPNATGVGVDISVAALEVAQKNTSSLGLDQRVQFMCIEWGRGLSKYFDIIVSNPPYIPTGIITTLEPEVKEYDPIQALDGGEDGLNCYRQLAFEVLRLLKPDGRLFVEIGQGQEKEVETIFQASGLKHLSWHQDIQGIVRCGVFCLANS
jgi:release factor glutamine methyltransferase